MKNTLTQNKPKYHLKPASTTEYNLLEEDGYRYELIEGLLTMAPAPYMIHQKISMELTDLIRMYLKKHPIGDLYYAPVDVELSNKNIFQPDLLFVSKDRLNIITEKRIMGSPDLIIEILSESSYELDTKIKYKIYEDTGVQEYWIVDPNKKSMIFYQLTDKSFKEIPYDNQYSSRILKDFTINPQNFFQNL